MARPVVGDKRSDIRKATVAEVTDCGIANASVNRIAKRAQLSVGSIYRHFASKDQLLRTVFLEIKSDLHQSLMKVADEFPDSNERIRAIWFAMLDFAHQHPNDFLFAEKVSQELDLDETEAETLEVMTREMRQIIESAMADGTLRQGSAATHIVVLSAPAIQLARTAASQQVAVDRTVAEDVFQMLWSAVAKI